MIRAAHLVVFAYYVFYCDVVIIRLHVTAITSYVPCIARRSR